MDVAIQMHEDWKITRLRMSMGRKAWLETEQRRKAALNGHKIYAKPIGPKLILPQREIQSIQRIVAKEYGITIEEMTSPQINRRVKEPRWIAMLLCAEAGKSLMQIGRYFNRDHSSVIYALGRMRETKDSMFLGKVEKMRALTKEGKE